jgi:protein phosphatase
MKISLISRTHVGYEREINEDAVAVCPDLLTQRWSDSESFISLGDLGALAVVADGMGGTNAGEIASFIAVSCVKRCFSDISHLLDTSDDDRCSFLCSAISMANEEIMKKVNEDPNTIGMGTTIVLLWLIGNKAHIAWCGDCRCYLFNRSNELCPLTKDHSYVQELVDRGEIRPDQMIGHPDGSLITRGIGDIDVETTPDSLSVKVNEGDIFLLCSDGLCGYCDDATIQKIIRKHNNSNTVCCQELLNTALSTGGHDNITLALLSTISNRLDTSRCSVWKRLFPFLTNKD